MPGARVAAALSAATASGTRMLCTLCRLLMHAVVVASAAPPPAHRPTSPESQTPPQTPPRAQTPPDPASGESQHQGTASPEPAKPQGVERTVQSIVTHRDGAGGQREVLVAWSGSVHPGVETWEHVGARGSTWENCDEWREYCKEHALGRADQHASSSPSSGTAQDDPERAAGDVPEHGLAARERERQTETATASATETENGPALGAGDEPEFEVGAVYDHRDGVGGQREYLVAWVGFPDEEQDTWEPSQNLTEHAGEILTAYEARLSPRRRQPTAAAISGRGRGLGRGRARGRGRGRARGRGRRPGPAKTTLNAAKLNENYKWCTTATHDCGELGDRKCVHCRALLYTSEVASHSPLLGPGYNRGKSCCADGKVVVPAIKFDPEIGRLFQDASQEVHQTPGSIMVAHARKINNALSMASLKIDEVFPGRGHYNPGLTIRGK